MIFKNCKTAVSVTRATHVLRVYTQSDLKTIKLLQKIEILFIKYFNNNPKPIEKRTEFKKRK
jgi:hypothetical protein